MINFDSYANENKTEHNLKWPYIPDHPYRIIIGVDEEKMVKSQPKNFPIVKIH